MIGPVTPIPTPSPIPIPDYGAMYAGMMADLALGMLRMAQNIIRDAVFMVPSGVYLFLAFVVLELTLAVFLSASREEQDAVIDYLRTGVYISPEEKEWMESQPGYLFEDDLDVIREAEDMNFDSRMESFMDTPYSSRMSVDEMEGFYSAVLEDDDDD